MNCEYKYTGCWYYENGKCTYHTSPIKIEIGQACYQDKIQNRIECELDYLNGTWM